MNDLGAVQQLLEISSKCSSLTSPICIEKEAYRVFIYCTSAHYISKRTDYTNILLKIPSLSDWEYYIPTVGTSKRMSMHSPKICHGWALKQCVECYFWACISFFGTQAMNGRAGKHGKFGINLVHLRALMT